MGANPTWGTKRKRKMTELSENILRLRAEGKNYNEIKNELGCSKGTISYYLGEDQKEKTGVRRRDNRSKNLRTFHSYKEEIGCTDCGEKYPYFVLEFDHKPEFEKIDTVYKVLTKYGVEKAWEEIAKCDVVCANCHKIRTYMRKPFGEGPLTLFK